MSAIKLVIFDVAGTIVEDHGEVLHAFDTALRKHGIVCDEAELAEWKGASKREVIRHFVAQESPREPRSTDERQRADRVEAIDADFRRILETHYQHEVRPVAGASETFAWLRRHGIQAATTTGFYREVSDLVLQEQAGATCSPRASRPATCGRGVPRLT